MGYHVTLHATFERDEDGIRHGRGALASAYCSAFTPDRQQRAYGVDFMDLLVFFLPDQPEVAMIGDPEIENQDLSTDARGVWTPDWKHARTKLEKLEKAATEAGDERSLGYLPEWRDLVEIGSKNPDAVVSWSF